MTPPPNTAKGARMPRLLRRLRDESAGFTLVELVVASSLTVVIAVIIGGILITTLGSEKTIRTTTEATSNGQLVAQTIDKGVRNATWIDLTAASGEYFLTVRTASSTAVVTYSCQAWYITPAGSAYMRTSPTKITKPTGGNVTGWTLLTGGIQQSGTASILSRTGRQIDMTFEVDAGDAQNVLISTSALSRQTSTESAPCA
jgi:type II secretory pathway pseudopilin PulG